MIDANQIKGARAMLGWSAKVLADKSGLGLATIQRMEGRGTDSSSTGNVKAVQAALEAGGVSFVDPNGMGAGVRLRDREE